jgi:hypothetical protein
MIAPDSSRSAWPSCSCSAASSSTIRLLSVFNHGGTCFGMPPLYAWLMASWLALIVADGGWWSSAEATDAAGLGHRPRLLPYLGVLFGIAWYADRRADPAVR